jgi:hypothetical protein
MKRTTVTDRKSLNRLLAEAAANTARLSVGGEAPPKDAVGEVAQPSAETEDRVLR